MQNNNPESQSQLENAMEKSLNLISSADIARMANVTPARVSQWRRMANNTFPKPLRQGVRGPLFDASEVAEWIVSYSASDSRVTARSDQDLPGSEHRQRRQAQAIWNLVSSRNTNSNPGMEKVIPDTKSQIAVARAVLALSVIQSLAPNYEPHVIWPTLPAGTRKKFQKYGLELNDFVEIVHSAFGNIFDIGEFADGHISSPQWHPSNSQEGAMEVCIAINALQKTGEGWIDELIEVGRRRTRLSLSEIWTDKLLVSLVSKISGLVQARAVYDPVIGTGALAIACARLDNSHVPVIGQDIEPLALGIAVARAVKASLPIGVSSANTLADDGYGSLVANNLGGEEANLIVADLPSDRTLPVRSRVNFRTPSGGSFEVLNPMDPRWIFGAETSYLREPTWLWLQHVISKLAPGGLGIVATSGKALTSEIGSAARRAILMSGHLAAVVELPSPRPVELPQSLWILRGSPMPGADVLLVDLDESVRRSETTEPSDSLVDELVHVLERWWQTTTMASNESPNVLAAVASVSELIRGSAEIDVRSRVSEKVDRVDGDYVAQLEELLLELSSGLKSFEFDSNIKFKQASELPARLTLQQVQQQYGALEVIRGSRLEDHLSSSHSDGISIVGSDFFNENEKIEGRIAGIELSEGLLDRRILRKNDLVIYRRSDRERDVHIWDGPEGTHIISPLLTIVRVSESPYVSLHFLASAIRHSLQRSRGGNWSSALLNTELPYVSQVELVQKAESFLAKLIEQEEQLRSQLAMVEKLKTGIVRGAYSGIYPDAAS